MSYATYANQEPDFPGQCAAAAKHSGARCRKHAVNGRAVCKQHGGDSPSGIAHPNYKHGERAKPPGRYTLDGALGREYERFMANKESLIEAADEMAYIAARVQVINDEIAAGNTGNITRDALGAWRALKAAIAGKNAVKIRECIAILDDAMIAVEAGDAKQQEIYGLLDLLRKQRTTEVRRMQVERETANVQQMRTFLAAVTNVILQVCALAPTKELEWQMRNRYESEMRRVLALPIVGS